MKKLKLSNVLLIGKNSENIRKLKNLLVAYFTDIIQIEELNGNIAALGKIHLNLIIMTDSMDFMPDAKLLSDLKSRFPEAKILGQFERIDAAIEIELRSKGLIFLGSLEHLRKNFDDIFKTIVDKTKFN